MNQSEYEQLRNKFESDYRANIEALDRVFAASKSINGAVSTTTTATPKANGSPAESDDGAGKGVILNAVSEILRKLPGRFTWRDVIETAASEYPDIDFKSSSVRQAVMRLVETKKIAVVVPGKGRTPSIYSRAN